jgi:hypothetical protein
MGNSSILGGEHAATRPSGTDADALGPSDTSDSGSDVQTERNHSALPDEGAEGAFPISHDSSSDAGGTGERASADANAPETDADILPDRIGTVPQDAMDAALSIDDPAAASVDELAVSEDDDEEDDGEA